MKGKKQRSELNSRQWALYRFLKRYGDKWITQEWIVALMREYPADETTFDDFHNSAVRHKLTDDIRRINDSAVIQKVIISSSKGVKLANKTEFKEYINKQYAAVFRRLKRVRTKAKKGGLDGQIKITFNKERDTIESFINSIIS